MFKLLITTIAIAIMTEGIVNYPFYDPSIETDNNYDQDFNGNEIFKIIDDMQFNTLEPISPQFIEKRDRSVSDPCGCPYNIEYVHLGPNAYPKKYKTKVCDKNQINKRRYCNFGARCREFYYEVRYLIPKVTDGSEHLPAEINRIYGWVSKNISIDCRCLH
ncbi:prothoracicotropic hormone-like [Chironomus tepperi]|uniref:prothoracicotropic hormone-like n=1 Tax=Chironomus tepperi TaxID=113505 RepID=UPI00391F5542